jgi:hypothetical protein
MQHYKLLSCLYGATFNQVYAHICSSVTKYAVINRGMERKCTLNQ